jgi:hypothetical protein
MIISIIRLFRPLFRHKLKKLEAFEGPETYAQQMRRHRLFQSIFVVLNSNGRAGNSHQLRRRECSTAKGLELGAICRPLLAGANSNSA